MLSITVARDAPVQYKTQYDLFWTVGSTGSCKREDVFGHAGTDTPSHVEERRDDFLDLDSLSGQLNEAKLKIEAETVRADREALAARQQRTRVEQCQAELERQQAQHATERRMLGEEMAQSFLENSATRMNLEKRDKEIRENRMRIDLATKQLKQARAKFEKQVREWSASNGHMSVGG